MTDTDDRKSADTAADTAPSAAVPGTPSAPPIATASNRGRHAGLFMGALLLLILLAAVLGAALYYQNKQYRSLQADMQQERESSQGLLEQVHQLADQALGMARQQSGQLHDLRNALNSTAGQVHELDQALQLMTDSGSDLLLLNDIEHLLTLADQQLIMGGNVANAIISLESAQARLARANRPALAALQQSINGDIDRLRAVSTINLPVLSERINHLSELVGSAPLLVPESPAQQVAPSEDPAPKPEAESSPQGSLSSGAESDWQDMAGQAWERLQDTAKLAAHDLRQLMDVRRVDDPAALLMSPEQSQRFREALKQKVMMAQLALLMQQTRIWKTELDQVAQAIDERYDMRSEDSRKALALARELHDTSIQISLPGISNSQAALAAAREAEQNAMQAPASDASPASERQAGPDMDQDSPMASDKG